MTQYTKIADSDLAADALYDKVNNMVDALNSDKVERGQLGLRKANTAYATGAVCYCEYHPEFILKCTAGGTTGSSPLDTSGTLVEGQNINDGGVVWKVYTLATQNWVESKGFITDSYHDDTKLDKPAYGTTGQVLTKTETGEEWADAKGGYFPSLLEHKWSDHIINDMSWVRADTFSWLDRAVYPSVYELLLGELRNGETHTDTIGGITVEYELSPNGYKIVDGKRSLNVSAVEQLFNQTGVAWYYILDRNNNRFKLPRTKYGFVGLRDSVGNYVPESLPNITGSVASATLSEGDIGAESGALYRDHINHGYRENNSGTAGDLTLFDASRSSSTYQNNAPVQQRATQMYLYFYVGEYSQTAVEQTAGITSEQLNQKLDADRIQEVSVPPANPIPGVLYLIPE